MTMNDVFAYLKKIKSNPLAKTNQSHKSSNTIFKGSWNERHGKRVKVEINASLFLKKSIFK
jgi:hypothetical protein